MITINHYRGYILNITEADLRSFERKLVAAARQRSEVEVNVVNPRRGYILFANWQPDYETPRDFASGEIALVLDGVANIAAL